MSSTLAELQRAFAAHVCGEGEAVDDDALAAFAEGVAVGSARLTPREQLAIYREQFLLRHLDVLRDDFQSLLRLLGAEAFDRLATGYLQAFPPTSFTLRDLGRELAPFAASHAPWSHDPLVAELARVEWAFVEAFDAPDASALDAAALSGLAEDAWPSMRVALQPAARLLAMEHAAHDYRLAVRRAEATVARPGARRCWAVVFRGPELLQCLDLEQPAFVLLGALGRGLPLGEACDEAARSLDEEGRDVEAFEANVGVWFQRWTTLGILAGAG